MNLQILTLRHLLLWLPLVFLTTTPALALEALKLAPGEAVTLDGRPSEGFWQRAQAINEFWDFRPQENVRSKYATELRIAYDQKKLYVAVAARDPDPSLIRAPFVRRDKVLGDQDFIAVLIDPVGDKKFAQFFRVSANGVIGDGIFNDANTEEDFSPDFEFEGVAQRTETGWTAEIAIPFASLRYANPPPKQWHLLAFRGITREEFHRSATVRVPRDFTCLVCYAEPLTGFTDLPSTAPLLVVPQGTVANRRERLDGSPSRSKNELKIGVDVKYRPRPETVVDVTINPDFSQVELDTPQLSGNSQFALFFPEKRPFFLEGADLLESPGRVIYTRSITDPAWGARLTQRSAGLSYTVLTARDDGRGLVLLPNSLRTNFAAQSFKSQATVARAKWGSGALTYGAVLTDRSIAGGQAASGYNRVAGADLGWRPDPDQRVRAQWLQSQTSALPGANGVLTRAAAKRDHAGFLDWSFNSERWNLYLQGEDVGRDFRADNGFYSQTGFREIVSETRYKFGTPFGLNEFNLFFNAERKLDSDGRLLYQQQTPGLFMAGSRATNIVVEWRPNQKVRVANDGTPRKRDQFYVSAESQPARWLPFIFAELAVGDRVDVANNRTGKGAYFGSNARLRLGQRFELEPRIENAWIDSHEPVAGNKRILHERSLQLLGIYHLNAQDSLRLIVQRASLRRAPSLYIAPVNPLETSQTWSMVYSHRRSLYATLYAGATVGRESEPQAGFKRKQTEVFVKAAWPVDWL